MDVFKLLKQDHQEAKMTFRALVSKSEVDWMETRLLCNKLLLHMEMEETYFYPFMEHYTESRQLTEESKSEHAEAKKIIQELLGGRVDNREYKTRLERLETTIVHHIEKEENQMFPLASRKLSEEQLQDIAEKMLILKQQKEPSLKV